MLIEQIEGEDPDGLATRVLHGVDDRDSAEVLERISCDVERDTPVVAFVYAGPGRMQGMLTLCSQIMRAREDASIIVLTCGCIDVTLLAMLRLAIENDVIRHVVMGECGAQWEMRAIRNAVRERWPLIQTTDVVLDHPSANTAELGT